MAARMRRFQCSLQKAVGHSVVRLLHSSIFVRNFVWCVCLGLARGLNVFKGWYLAMFERLCASATPLPFFFCGAASWLNESHCVSIVRLSLSSVPAAFFS